MYQQPVTWAFLFRRKTHHSVLLTNPFLEDGETLDTGIHEPVLPLLNTSIETLGCAPC